MAGIDKNGFTKKRLPDIITDLKARASILFNDLVPAGDVVNTGDNTVIGRQIGLVSPSIADLWEAAQQDYDAFSINAATGVSLDNLCALGGVKRKSASASTVALLLGGSPATVVPAGSLVGSPTTGKSFATLGVATIGPTHATGVTVDVLTVANTSTYTVSFQKYPDTLSEGVFNITITSDSSATKAEILLALKTAIDLSYSTLFTTSVATGILVVNLIDPFTAVDFSCSDKLGFTKAVVMASTACTETGPLGQPSNSITNIQTPVLGWDTANNPASAVLGQNDENDEQLRLRYNTSKFTEGSNSIESLYSSIFNVVGVQAVAIYENTTDVAFVSPPVPAHSFYPVVLGGSTTDIALAIWNNKPLGISSYGSVTTNVLDSQKIPHSVSFDRPATTDIYITVTVKALVNFPADGATQIKTAIINFLAENYKIGDDIEWGRIFSPVNSVAGHYPISLFLGTTASPTATSNISIDYNKIYATSTTNIIVNVT